MKVNIIKEERVFDNFFKINRAQLEHELFNGEMSGLMTRLNFERGDSVAAIVFNTDNSEAVFVKQFRYPAYTKGLGWLVETIAGVIDKGESPEAAIKREILEELGYEITYTEKIATFFVSPGGTSERIILFYTEVGNSLKTQNGGGRAGEQEDIQAVTYTLPELAAALKKNEIMDAKTIIGVNYLLSKKGY